MTMTMRMIWKVSALAMLGMTLSCGPALKIENPLPVAMGDPFLLCPSGGGYYLYGTSDKYNGFVTYRSQDLFAWEELPRVFDTKQQKAWGTNCHWAPEVYERNGRFYMFYSANWKENPNRDAENFRIGVAVSDSPEGPFVNVSTGPLFDPGFPVIDAHVYFDDEAGTTYLYFSRCCYKNPVDSELAKKMREEGVYEEITESWIYGIALKPDFSGTIGEPVLLVRPAMEMDDPQNEWESRSVLAREINMRWSEGPYVIKHGGRYHMIYSANFYAGSHYAMGCAVSDSPLGPFVKSPLNPIMQGDGKVTGTGHGMFATLPSGQMVCVYHGRTAETGEARVVFIDKMHFSKAGDLVIDGPTLHTPVFKR